MMRRPIALRDSRFARDLATRAVAAGLSPDRISQASIAAAAVAGGLFWASGPAGPWLGGLCLILGAVCVQLRLLANLLDGMVAVEGGRGGPRGAFWNEAPDRLSDILILWGFGAAAGRPDLGLLAAALAVCTAYLREFGRAEGFGADFGGPLAKPQRMALVTGAAVVSALTAVAGLGTPLLIAALWILIAGTALTAVLRARRILAGLDSRGG